MELQFHERLTDTNSRAASKRRESAWFNVMLVLFRKPLRIKLMRVREVVRIHVQAVHHVVYDVSRF